jgi:hypothetical protein
MKIELTPENGSIVDKYTTLTGFTREELANWFLADYFGMFEQECFLEETIGCMRFNEIRGY